VPVLTTTSRPIAARGGFLLAALAACGPAVVPDGAGGGPAGGDPSAVDAGAGGGAGGASAAGGAGGGGAPGGGAPGGLDAGARDSGVADAGGEAPFRNQAFELPVPAAEQGMTCAWLDGDNCWKQLVASAAACGPAPSSVGRLSADGRQCTFATGHVIDFAGALTPLPSSDGGTVLHIAAFRVRGPVGQRCLETAYGWGKQRFRAGALEVFQNASGITTEITCPDGVRYAQSAPDACAGFGARWAVGETPLHVVACDASECTITFSGAPQGRQLLARCRP
jgi:hypothetical protein